MMRRWFANVIFVLTLRCKGFERIESRSLDESIGWLHYFAKMGHWLACGRCRHTTHQLDAIEKAVQVLPPTEEVSLPVEARERIANRLRYSGSDSNASKNSQEG